MKRNTTREQDKWKIKIVECSEYLVRMRQPLQENQIWHGTGAWWQTKIALFDLSSDKFLQSSRV